MLIPSNVLLSLSTTITLLACSAFELQGRQNVFSRPSSRFYPRVRPPLITISSSSATFTSAESSSSSASDVNNFRSRLRKVTGFSLTVFRATLRGVTGISLTTLYAGTVAATGLWIRKTMSVLLSVFPSGFRYFLQPFLVVYYTPLILLRLWTGPTRKNAAVKHKTVVGAWKEAVEVAEKAELGGYWPVVVSEDGYFELNKPPSVRRIDDVEEVESNVKMADAIAEAVEQAMEVNEKTASE